MRILRLSTLSLGLAIAAFSFSYMNPSVAGPPDANGCHEHKEDCGGGAGITYTAQLTTGTFQFSAVNVIPNTKENGLIPKPGGGNREFFRPGDGTSSFSSPFLGDCSALCFGGVGGDGSCIDTEEETNRLACDDWDAVIESCDHLVDTGLNAKDVPSFTVSADNLGFEAPGGGLVHIHGIEVIDPDTGELFMGLNFLLIGDCFDGCINDFVPVPDGDFNPKTKTIPLTTVRVTGHTVAKGKKGHCNKDGHIVTLNLPNDLEIEATDPDLGLAPP